MTLKEVKIAHEGWSLERAIDYLQNEADPRVENWPLAGSPYPLCITIALYLTVVWLGPKWMSTREAFKLRVPLILYNIFLTVMSMYMFYEVFTSAYLAGYSLGCQPVDYSYSPLAMRMARVCWLYYISKYIELADTVFFILRKKNNQLSFLHVYHHTSIMIDWYFGVKYIAGGQSFLIPLMNSFVHIWMYSYYGLAAVGPHMQKYLWWKRYLTKMQITQFFLALVHFTHSIAVGCDFPQGFTYAVLLSAVIFIILFANFYYKEYVVRAAKAKKST